VACPLPRTVPRRCAYDKSNLPIQPIDRVNIGVVLLAQIEAFLTVAERRSVSAASEVLYVTQPALTTRIKNLERELGVDLFVRHGRGMRLTAAGRAFRPHAQRALQSLAAGRELLRELREGGVGELLVGAAPAISTYVLPLVLTRFQAAFPNVHLIVRTGHSEEVLELVLREQVQIGLVRELPHAAVASTPLYEDEIVLVVHPRHRFAAEASIAVAELADERLILFDRTSSYFVLTSAFFREAGVVPRGVMELDNVDATKKMVEHGLGIAFLPYTAVRAELADGALREVAIDGYEPVRRPIVAIRRRDAVVPEDLVGGLLGAVVRDELER
jgi:DNA-binding transcriptional LysR family regulator